MKRIEYLISRSASLYQDFGFSGLLNGIEKYIRHGSFRNDVIRIVPATEQFIQTYVKIGNKISPSNYSDADPLKILWVDPNQIKYTISKSQPPSKFGRVYYGDWDQSAQKFTSQTVYKSLENHFVEDVPWKETQYYKNKYKKLKRGKPTRGCSSIEDLPQYFADIDELYSDIVDSGYQTQQTLLSKNPDQTTRKNLDAPTAIMNEIGVSIGRNGTLFHHYRGVHRLAIAKIAEIDQVPVQVLVRHEQWQAMREKIQKTRSDTNFVPNIKHPDLNDISNLN